jgi:hypothetical protein
MRHATKLTGLFQTVRGVRRSNDAVEFDARQVANLGA